MHRIETLNKYGNEYDNWVDINKYVFQSELNAIKKVFPKSRNIIEIGIGSRIFVLLFGIKKGVEPSETMRQLTEKRKII